MKKILLSLPPREAWIEITTLPDGMYYEVTSLPPREAWIEIERNLVHIHLVQLSLPPREAWIEMMPTIWTTKSRFVASPAGSVD